MSRYIVAFGLAFCVLLFAAEQASAQYFGGYSPNYGGGYPGYASGGGGYYGGCGGYTDPRLGYCLKNDCFCNPGSGGLGGYGGCGGPTSIIVRVRTGKDGKPVVTTYPPYPCQGCGMSNPQMNNPTSNQRFIRPPAQPRSAQPQTRQAPANRPRAQQATYRYKF